MALPSSGSISLGQVNTELGVSATATRSLNDSTTRTLFNVSSGTISLSNGYGKANQFAFTISSNQTNANLRTLAINAGWNQSSKVVATINSGVYVSANSTGTPGLTISGSFPGGVDLINNGYIIGQGGNGGAGIPGETIYTNGGPGGNGGNALSVSTSVTITNNGIIAGGGGGGGGSDKTYIGDFPAGGSGGGGGRTGTTASSGGAAGSGARYQGNYSYLAGVSGGAGYSAAAGAGGGGVSKYTADSYFGQTGSGTLLYGGNGGGWGSNGGAGQNTGNFTASPGGGGAAGYAVSGNGYISWAATGTRYGGIA